MKIHAIQTGSVRVKTAQVEGRGEGISRHLAIFRDRQWTDWLPTFAWAIEHETGVIVVDTGQGTHLLQHRSSFHPYTRWEVEFQIEPEQEIGPQLRALGISRSDVRTVVLTHLHMDHDGGLRHFDGAAILASRQEIAAAVGWPGRLRGYLPHRWPTWFEPIPLDLIHEEVGPFGRSRRLTANGDVVVVDTAGHTPNHISVIAWMDRTAFFIAGDASYTQELMLSKSVDGVSMNAARAIETLDAIRRFASSTPTVYLPTHDPKARKRLESKTLVASMSGIAVRAGTTPTSCPSSAARSTPG